MRRNRTHMALAVWFIGGVIAASSSGADEAARASVWRGPEVHRLVGIVGGEAEHAQAVFENLATGSQRLYRVGDRIEGASVSRIERRRVWLQKDDRTVAVTVGRGRAEDRSVSGPVPSAARPSEPGKRLQKLLQSEKPPYDPSVEKRGVPRRDRDRFVKGLQERRDQGSALEPTDFGPAINLSGLDPGLLRVLSLEPADKIVGVSGMGLDSEARFNEILSILQRAKVFNLSVLRGDSVQSLYYSSY